MTQSPSAWQRLGPARQADALAPIDAYLAEPATVEALDAAERSGEPPLPVLAGLRARSLADLFTPELATGPDLGALNAMTARRSGSLAITVGVNGLALLPVYLAGDDRQRRLVADRLRAGAAAAMLLTEWDHGSNLLRNEASATAEPDGFRLDGTKQLINGGTGHELLVTLLRTGVDTRPAPGLRDFTLFLVERDGTVEALPRWRTLTTRAADISGVRFHGTRVSRDAVLGRVGEGFAIVQKTLMMSHGGIAALASGAASGALDIALRYARTRDVYGGPIAELGPIREHLARMAALDVVIAAAAVRAAYAGNRFGPGAGYFTAAAKYACCGLAEEAVTEGRRVLGARALLEDLPYARFVRDVLLYGVFDGTGHLMLDDLGSHLLRAALDTRRRPALELTRQMYATPPQPLVSACRQPWRPYAPALAARCADLAEASGSDAVRMLGDLASALGAVVRTAHAGRRWAADQAFRFAAAALLAELEALLATCELVLPACRTALGLTGDPAHQDIAAARYAIDWIGRRVRHRLADLAHDVGCAEVRWAALEDRSRLISWSGSPNPVDDLFFQSQPQVRGSTGVPE